jgi:hypothetical protein
MLDSTTRDKILECYRRAQDARRFIARATTPADKADIIEVERRWLSLARELRSQLVGVSSAAAQFWSPRS